MRSVGEPVLFGVRRFAALELGVHVAAFEVETLEQFHWRVRPPAFWQALAERPDVTSLGTVRDRLDRNAVALVAPGATASQQLILFADPETGAFTGYEEILVGPDDELGLAPPAVISLAALSEVEAIPVDQAPAA
ncbi:MAG: hypothetical protein QM655_02260 [Nocardioidaceae bacterium]